MHRLVCTVLWLCCPQWVGSSGWAHLVLLIAVVVILVVVLVFIGVLTAMVDRKNLMSGACNVLGPAAVIQYCHPTAYPYAFIKEGTSMQAALTATGMCCMDSTVALLQATVSPPHTSAIKPWIYNSLDSPLVL